MTIKQQGGVFGRHPEFSSVEIDGVGIIQKSGSDLEIAAPSGVKITGPSFWGLDVDGGVQIQDDFLRILRNANTSYAEIGVDATSAYLRSTFSNAGTSDFRFVRNSAEIMRITASGITFGGDTAAANALDDYEEGTWTPVVYFGGANTGMSVATTGHYTLVGRLVVVRCSIIFSAKGSSTGTFQIGNLPFVGSINGAGAMGFNYAWATMPIGGVSFIQSSGSIYAMAANNGAYMDDTYFNDVTAVNDITISYMI